MTTFDSTGSTWETTDPVIVHSDRGRQSQTPKRLQSLMDHIDDLEHSGTARHFLRRELMQEVLELFEKVTTSTSWAALSEDPDVHGGVFAYPRMRATLFTQPMRLGKLRKKTPRFVFPSELDDVPGDD